MKAMFVRISILLFLLSMLLSGCLPREPLKLVKIEKVRIGEISNKQVQLFVDARIANTNHQRIKIKSGEFDLMINNHSLGKTSINKPLFIKGNGESVYTLELNTRYSDIIKSGISGLGGLLFEKKLSLRCSGWVKGSSMGISRTLPFQFEGEFPVSELNNIKNGT